MILSDTFSTHEVLKTVVVVFVAVPNVTDGTQIEKRATRNRFQYGSTQLAAHRGEL
jgi:hypothetical protein